MASDAVEQADAQLKSIIHNLYALTVQALDYPSTSTSTAMRTQITQLISTLSALQLTSPQIPFSIPTDIISYVERGRNPDIYTREFVEAAQSLNQEMKGRSEAYAMFRDVLAAEIVGGVDGVEDDVVRIVGRSVSGISNRGGGERGMGGGAADAVAGADTKG